MKYLKKILHWQFDCSMAFDKAFVPEERRIYGTADFHRSLIPAALDKGLKIYDVGGGKAPHIHADTKKELDLTLIGLDIDEAQLKAAPEGIYDEIIVADITRYDGRGDGDLVISRAVMEHINGVPKAISNMRDMVKEGGRIVFFAPCRNAWFARINMVMPERWKVKLINALYTEKVEQAKFMGFKAYYDHCTPSQIEKLAEENELKIVERRLYYMSNYFAFFTPLYILWRGYQYIAVKLGCDNLCEGFAYILEKKPDAKETDHR